MSGSTTGASEILRANAVSVSLTVKDVHQSLAWYRDVLGFTLERTREHEGQLRSAYLRSGDARIALNQDDGARGWTRVKGEGFSLLFTTTQSVDAIARGIRERGGALETEPTDTPWGTRSFRLRDPDGYKFAVSTPRPS